MKLNRNTSKRIGELLIDANILTEEQLQAGLKQQKDSGSLLGEVFVKSGMVTEEDLARCIAEQFGVYYRRIAGLEIPDELMAILPFDFMMQHSVLVFDKTDDGATVAIAGSLDQQLVDEIKELVNCEIRVCIALRSELNTILFDYQQRIQG